MKHNQMTLGNGDSPAITGLNTNHKLDIYVSTWVSKVKETFQDCLCNG
jgi:hypothetical protein